MRICVQDLEAYNNGRLVFEWVDIEGLDEDEINEEIQARLDKWGKEEYMVADYDGIPSDFGEYPSIADLAQYIELCDEHGKDIVDAWISYYGNCNLDKIGDAYHGTFKSEDDFAIEHAENCGLLENWPDSMIIYFDYKAYRKDLLINDFIAIETSTGDVVIFSRQW